MTEGGERPPAPEHAASERRPAWWWAPLLALLAVGALVWSQRRTELNLADEGFLWYGVQRTLAGEVPMRDFQAYDPGRYAWCAALSPLVGDGIVGVRTATAAFAALGVWLALLVASRFARHAGELAVCALVLGLWLFPRHKLYEPALASATAWLALRLLESPTARAHLWAGVFVGASALIGRNHALYSGLALGACALYLAWKRPELRGARRPLALAAGVALGLAPLAALLLFLPGFAAGYWRSLELVLTHGANLPLAYPFPWREEWAGLAGWALAGRVALSAAFLLPFAVLPWGALVALRARGAELRALAAPLGAFFAGAAYVHHVSVRSDAPHLAQALPPLLLLALALAGRTRARAARPVAWALLVLVSALAASEANWLLARLRPDVRAETVELEVAGERLELGALQAGQLAALQSFAARQIPGDEPLWVVNQPALYPVLGKVSPSWWLLFYWAEPEAEQREHVRALDEKGVDWVIVRLRSAADAEERGFPSTHPIVWRHLNEAFRPVSLPGLPNGLQLFRRRT